MWGAVHNERGIRMSDYTQVRLRRSTTKRLKALGEMGDSYDAVINKLIDKIADDDSV